MTEKPDAFDVLSRLYAAGTPTSPEAAGLAATQQRRAELSRPRTGVAVVWTDRHPELSGHWIEGSLAEIDAMVEALDHIEWHCEWMEEQPARISPRATLEALLVGVVADEESAAALAHYDRIIAGEDDEKPLRPGS